jgi:formylglycine-generating enzyme required for sulfatase activity
MILRSFKQIFFFMIGFLVLPFSLYAETNMVLIPSGEYSLGSHYCEEEQGNADWCNDETPRKVKLESFWIDKYEVTNADYRECFIVGECEPAVLHEDRPEDFSKPTQPATFVNWKEAQSYCVWKGGNLPTEIQWEAAAQGEKLGGAFFKQLYGTGAPESVGKFEANSNGLYDMMGNVYEWTLDGYGPLSAKGEIMNSSSKTKDRIVRGGAWNSPGHYLRTSDRVKKDSEFRYSDVGFRCVKTDT